MVCPHCKLINPDATLHCDCGYNFQTGAVDAGFAPKARPMELRSARGTGKQMLGYRPAGPGLFEATVWFTFAYVPVFPLSAWLLRLRSQEGGAFSSTYFVDFVERRKLSLFSILLVYAATLAIAGPFLAAGFFFAASNPGTPSAKSTGIWFLISAVWTVGWAGTLRWRRDRLYETARTNGVTAK